MSTTFTLTLSWWLLPVLITIVALWWAMTKEKFTGRWGQGIETIFYLVPALAVSCVSWIVYAILK